MFDWYFLSLQTAALSSALVAGVFLTFSDFVMRSLAKAGETAGAIVMQNINREVFRWIFMCLLLGMSIASPILAGIAAQSAEDPARYWVLAGGITYFLGVFGVTMAVNVPRNNRLELIDTAEPAALEYWKMYLSEWTFWNHLRTASAALAAVSFLVAGNLRLLAG